MQRPNKDLMCYARFKLAISTASVAAAKIDGVVGGHMFTLIDATCELANGFVHDWTGIWSTSDERTILEQYDNGLKVCRSIQQSMKSLSEIYEQRRIYYEKVEIEKQARRGERALEQSSASPDTAGTSDSESQPGPSLAPLSGKHSCVDYNEMFTDNQAQPGATVEIKEEPLDDVLFNEHGGRSSTHFQSYDESDFDETKPSLIESQPHAVPKDEDAFDDVEPMIDLFCPTTGDARTMEDDEEEIAWRNEKVLHYPTEQYGHYEMRLEPTIRNQVFNPSNVIEIPYHVTPKRCYLCDEQVYYYLVAPFDKARRAAFLESMILTKTRAEESKMMHLKMTDARAHFCRVHIASGKDLPQNLPSHAKKRRTQEFMKKIESIKKSKVSAARYTIRAPEPPGSGKNAPLPVKVVVRPPGKQRLSSVPDASRSAL
ncbi:hypothetical protein PRIPAC_74589 [Pristionchus pacificus]|uniref:Uncharacterized protein n=1 Tax=Pristionchus pacificus TaxID=54126 RepID=A0A2A6C5G7_PRIPA|nr:hypothetical protein PRIPAC_74589 [Pristionchus pacificus]|eukprot:PDM73425.1 hypothetical protein PRIPAC_40781 [Pristionchus pacificus]